MEKKIDIDFASVVSQFEGVIREFRIRKVIYKSVFRGKGLEFDGYRYFEEKEDDVALIDWKASLRANRLLAKKYIEERDLNIYFVLDVSNKMLFGSKKKLKAEYAGEIIAALSHLIINSRDLPGLIMFSDKKKNFVAPSKSRNQFYLLIKSLSDVENYGGGFDFNLMLEYLLKEVKSPYSVVILVSDFVNLKRGFERNLKLLSMRFETMALMIRDPADSYLPKTSHQLYLQDPYSSQQILVDPSSIAGKYKELALKQKTAVRKICKQSGIDLLELETDKSFIIPLASFLKSRAERGRM